MKRTYLVLTITLIAGLVGCGDDEAPPITLEGGGAATEPGPPEGPPPKAGPLAMAAGKIVYRQTGNIELDTTIWFQDHGATVVIEEVMHHKTLGTHQRIIWRDGKTTMYDYKAKKATTYKLRVKATELGWFAHLTPDKLESVGWARQGTETVAGLECTVWTHKNLGVRSWVHGRLLIKEVNQIGGGPGQTKEAVSFEPLQAIPPEAFAYPGS